MKSIRSKIMITVLAVSLCSLFVLALVAIINLQGLRSGVVSMSDELGNSAAQGSSTAMENQIMTQLTELARAKAAIADEKLNKQQTYVQMTADYLGSIYKNPTKYIEAKVYPPNPALAGTFTAQLLYAPEIAANPARVASELALLGNATDMFLSIPQHDPDIESDYFSTESGFTVMIDTISDRKPETLEVRDRSWYQSAAKAGKLIWTDVFDDSMGRGLAITCAAPFYGADGTTLRGVVGFGSLISTMSKEIIKTTIGESGYAFVVNQECKTIISPNIQKDAEGKIIRENLLENEDESVRNLAEKMLKGEAGVSRLTFEGREVYMAYEPMKVLPWTVVTVIDVEEALAPANATRQNIETLTDGTVADLDRVTRGVIIAMVLVLVAAIVAVAFASAFLAKRITRPLGELIDGVARIGDGDLDVQLDVKTGDEIERLAIAFNGMTESLTQYISDLTDVTAEKERIGAELGVATQIQASMLPCIFPAFPEHSEFDIYATMEPAKEVGGDFYDFFLVDETHLGIVMADVSGKGVPAALFMVIAKTLIKNHAQNGETPATVLTNVNNQLCENNEAGMFVTAWMAVMDIQTGELCYANAGHNPPLLKRKEGSFAYLHSEPGFVLAGLEDMQYEQSVLTMKPGDQLYLYTDGVTEATNLADELYGEDRLNDVLNVNGDLPLSDLLRIIKTDIDNFADGAPQFDDITMLGLRYRGGAN